MLIGRVLGGDQIALRDGRARQTAHDHKQENGNKYYSEKEQHPWLGNHPIQAITNPGQSLGGDKMDFIQRFSKQTPQANQ